MKSKSLKQFKRKAVKSPTTVGDCFTPIYGETTWQVEGHRNQRAMLKLGDALLKEEKMVPSTSFI